MIVENIVDARKQGEFVSQRVTSRNIEDDAIIDPLVFSNGSASWIVAQLGNVVGANGSRRTSHVYPRFDIELMARDVRQVIAFVYVAKKFAVEAAVEFCIRERVGKRERERDRIGKARFNRRRQFQPFDRNRAAIELIANITDAAAHGLSAVAQKVRVVVVEADRGDLDLVAPIADPGFVVPAFLGPCIRIAGTGRRETARHTCQQYGITQLVGGAKTWQPLIDIGLTDTCRPI